MLNAFKRLVRALRGLDRRQVRIVIALFLAGSASVGFFAIAEEVEERETRRFDDAVLAAFRRPSNPAQLRGPGGLVYVVRDLTSLGGTTVLTLVTAAFAGWLALNRAYLQLVLLMGAVAGGVLLTFGLKDLFGRVRPDVVPPLMHTVTSSIPSAHSSMSAVVYLTIGSILSAFQERPGRRAYLLSMAVFVTLVVGLTRIMLGVHYPTDVLAGWSLGVAWSSACRLCVLLMHASHP